MRTRCVLANAEGSPPPSEYTAAAAGASSRVLFTHSPRESRAPTLAREPTRARRLVELLLLLSREVRSGEDGQRGRGMRGGREAATAAVVFFFLSRPGCHFSRHAGRRASERIRLGSRTGGGTHHVGLDGAVGGGVRDAGEREAGAHLVVVEEGLVGLVDGTGLGGGGARGDGGRRGASAMRSRSGAATGGCAAGGRLREIVAKNSIGATIPTIARIRWALRSRRSVRTTTLPAQEEQAPARQE